ncbi:MAG: tripartite tricarboxylate transporter substrate binding protein [Hyphomicrobiales bacterium]|nr:tripartite tricarboxylate transporter substrate binding protein [Hyphomicrobiales bacterium]MCP5373744.1 tripartite tricarboxylate transporter substrate binding protein [Hyphomicrobiales bacterium]
MKRMLIGAAAALALSFTAAQAPAADYPDRPVSLVVVYSPGGATDFQARIVTMMAGEEKYLGQPMVIINKPGAGGKVGWNQYASGAKTDGYELASYNVPHFIAQSIKFETKYNIDNLEPIANWGADPAVFVVNKDSPFNTMADAVKWAKDNPGKLTVSGAGLYVGHHIAFLQIQKGTGVEMKYVPHKGGAPALKSVLGGQVMAGVNNLSDAYRSRDNLKILGIADLERDKEFLPDVPTFKEQGYDVDDSSVNFRGIMVRKGTPQPIIDLLAAKVPEMFKNARVAKQMKAGGSPMRIMTREQVQTMWKNRQVFLKELLAGL